MPNRNTLRSLQQAFKNCTVATVAHRIQTIIDSDVIIVLSDGVLVENGPPSQLIANVSPSALDLSTYRLVTYSNVHMFVHRL